MSDHAPPFVEMSPTKIISHSGRWLSYLTTLARLLLGFDFLVNGLCWWWKILPYPSIYELPNPNTPRFVQAMIDTHFMFDLIKGIEVVVGLMLLSNAWIPLALVIVFPVTVAAWSVDFFILFSSLRANVLGWGTLLLNVFLLFTYIEFYRPLLIFHSQPFDFGGNKHYEAGMQDMMLQPVRRYPLTAFGVISNVAGLWTVAWLGMMIVQRLLGGAMIS